jgi:hypothetical protein
MKIFIFNLSFLSFISYIESFCFLEDIYSSTYVNAVLSVLFQYGYIGEILFFISERIQMTAPNPRSGSFYAFTDGCSPGWMDVLGTSHESTG